MADAVSTGYVPWQLPCPCVPSASNSKDLWPFPLEPLLGFWNPSDNPGSPPAVLEAALHQWWHELVGKCSSCGTLSGVPGSMRHTISQSTPLEAWAPVEHRMVYFISSFFLFILFSSIFPSTSHFTIPPWRLPRNYPKYIACKQLSVSGFASGGVQPRTIPTDLTIVLVY